MKKLMLHKADSQDQIYEHTRDGSYGEDHGSRQLQQQQPQQLVKPSKAPGYAGRGDGFAVIASNSSAVEITTSATQLQMNNRGGNAGG